MITIYDIIYEHHRLHPQCIYFNTVWCHMWFIIHDYRIWYHIWINVWLPYIHTVYDIICDCDIHFEYVVYRRWLLIPYMTSYVNIISYTLSRYIAIPYMISHVINHIWLPYMISYMNKCDIIYEQMWGCRIFIPYMISYMDIPYMSYRIWSLPYMIARIW